MAQDQQHPLEKTDLARAEELVKTSQPKPEDLVDLARLRIRYQNFPGAKKVQFNLDRALQKWQLTEDELFLKTRQLHEEGKVYRKRKNSDGQEDWS